MKRGSGGLGAWPANKQEASRARDALLATMKNHRSKSSFWDILCLVLHLLCDYEIMGYDFWVNMTGCPNYLMQKYGCKSTDIYIIHYQMS